MTHDLVERLRDPSYAGCMQHLRSYEEIDDLFNQAADKLETYMADADAHVSRIDLVRRQEDEIRDLKAENAALRAEKDGIRKAVIEEAATVAENATISVQHDWAPGPVTMPIDHRKNIASAIRNMGERA